MASVFADLPAAAPIEVFELTAAFNADTHPDKVNLGVGAYRTDDSKPYVLPVVQAVEEKITADHTLNHEYLPVSGLPEFRTACAKLILGENSKVVAENRFHNVQALGGTGALHIGMELLRNKMGYDTIYFSKPTWGNHLGIAKNVHFSNIKEYRYWCHEKRGIDLEGMLEDLRAAPPKSVVLLHACAHNPTGMDPTLEQWKQIAAVVREKNLFPFFDCAYQGFAADLDKDAEALRMFVDDGFEILAAQSFSKNFGLYNERIGSLLAVVSNAERVPILRSQLELIVRQIWSNPPDYGSRIVSTILNNPQLKREWVETLKQMADRIQSMRHLLFQKLKGLGTPGTWDHLVKQAGLFAFTGLTLPQVKFLINNYHIYVMSDGRINMCAITTKNADYVAGAIHEAVTKITSKV